MRAALLLQHYSRLSGCLPLLLQQGATAAAETWPSLYSSAPFTSTYTTSAPCSCAPSASNAPIDPNLEYSPHTDIESDSSSSSSSSSSSHASHASHDISSGSSTATSTTSTSINNNNNNNSSSSSSVPHLDPVLLERCTPQQRRLIQQLLRDCLTAEAAVTHLLRGQQLLLRNRPDAAAFADQEQQQVDAVRQVMARYRTRPSLLLSAARLAGFSLGAAATAAPPPIRAAVLGAVQDALTEQYNEHLRALREAGLSEEVPEVRALLLTLRNMQRAPEGAPDPPDLVALQQMQSIQDIGAVGAVGAVVKAATVGALELVSRVRL